MSENFTTTQTGAPVASDEHSLTAGVNGATVLFGGRAIGTFTGGSGGTPLVVSFGAGATPRAAQALLRNITFRSATDTPAAAPRTARVQAWSRRNARLFHLPQPIAAAAFGAAGFFDGLEPSGGARRFDWLYGHRPEPPVTA